MKRGKETRAAHASLTDLALLFLRLGTTAFGGPAAHIAIMEDEVVRRRRWLSREKFLDLLGATNLIPGPNSTEMAIHIGHQKRGWPGLLVAGICFILPAVLIVGTLAWVYVRFGKLPQVTGILYGVKPVIIVVVIQALLRLGKIALKTKLLIAITTVVVFCVSTNWLCCSPPVRPELLLNLRSNSGILTSRCSPQSQWVQFSRLPPLRRRLRLVCCRSSCSF